ncbi:hypothetical protein KFE94_09835 [bacterium SCSIO 12643]|nr:hypothetical protein KFE94_09835 [bacterium SCSIO 12643]
MNYLSSFFLLLIFTGCSLTPQQFTLSSASYSSEISSSSYTLPVDFFISNWNQHNENKKAEPYHLNLQIEQTTPNEFTFIISMELEKNSYYISPYSDGNFTGKFGTCLNKNVHLKPIGKMKELPQSKETKNPWGDFMVNFVYDNTLYKQKFTFNPEEDFKVDGHIHFTIEPRCTFEEISYTITNKSGKITVAKKQC